MFILDIFVTRLHERLGETYYIDALTGEQKVTSLWLPGWGLKPTTIKKLME
ncbi:hypothetical protein ABQG65_14020 [Yersinia alsatica]|uniref:hypothetical protein n=1 Tax=Yersinia alsatica TaxID=2890317 RepID=UPI0032EF6A88